MTDWVFHYRPMTDDHTRSHVRVPDYPYAISRKKDIVCCKTEDDLVETIKRFIVEKQQIPEVVPPNNWWVSCRGDNNGWSSTTHIEVGCHDIPEGYIVANRLSYDEALSVASRIKTPPMSSMNPIGWTRQNE